MKTSRVTAIIIIATALLFRSAVVFCSPVDTISVWHGQRDHRKGDVSLMAFRPEHPNGISVIVCPGGSYHWLDENTEGVEVAEWLNTRGITAFVLFYRTAGKAEFVWHSRILFRGVRHPDMISDGQRAIQWVTEHASEYGIDEDKIGMIGFSAGGHLVMSAACYSSTNFPAQSGILSFANRRPAFVAAIYPVVTMNAPYAHHRSRRGLLGDDHQGDRILRDSLSLEKHIPSDCPPVFLINCKDDPVVDYRNSILLDSALTAHGVDHKYILYNRGKHGFGVSDYYGSPESREWMNEFFKWLQALYPDICILHD